MRSFISQKRFILFLSVLSLVTLVLLASGLHDVSFRAGRTYSRAEAETIHFSVDRALEAITDVPAWKQVIFWVLLFLLVLLVASILSPEMRKRLIRMFIGFAVSFWAIVYLVQHNLLSLPDLSQGAGDRAGEALTQAPPPPAFIPPTLPWWVNFLISLGLVLVLLALALSLSRWWQRINRIRSLSKPLDDLALIAQSSLEDLASGSDWDDVIVSCYARMSEAVGRKRGLRRKEAMTPAEFARRLEQAGLPADPVRRLTRLFESVRYGAKKSSQREINEAVSCLTAILHYCGEPV